MNIESTDFLSAEVERLRSQLNEANETLDAIRSGQIDALVVNSYDGHQLYTLKTADHAYRVFIEQMTEGAVTLNASGLIVYSNSTFATLVNRTLSEVLGSYFADYISADHHSDFTALFSEGWLQQVKKEVSLFASGKIIPVLLSVNKLELEEETALSVIVTDLSTQKENEKQLQIKNEQLEILNKALIDSNHDLQQFASVASHDLQEPLRKIQVFSKFLKDRSLGEMSDQSKQYLEKILSSSQRMKVLIIDILNYSKLSAGDDYVEEVDLQLLVSEIVEDFDLKITEKNARIEVGALPVVEGNRGQLRQVFYNLISNALKFSRPNADSRIIVSTKNIGAGELGVSLADEDQYCRISVHDNGIGFDEQFAHSIFNLFEKLNPKSAFEGSGIGLAIAKKIVDKHHGLIIAKSSEGNGAEFNIILPFKFRKR
jgi:two-component system CheB/CheR fusion protein